MSLGFDFDFDCAKQPLAQLESERAAVAELCSEVDSAANTYVAQSGEFELRIGEEVGIWSARAQAARDVRAAIERQLESARMGERYLGLRIRLAGWGNWFRNLRKRFR